MYIIIPYIIFYYIKVIRQFGCFTGKSADERDNLVNNPKIYNVKGNNRLPHGLQLAIAQSTTPDNR